MKRPLWIAEARHPEELDELKNAGADGIVLFAQPFHHPFAKAFSLEEIGELKRHATEKGLEVHAVIDGIVLDRDVAAIERTLAEFAGIGLSKVLCFDETVGLIARSLPHSIPTIYASDTLLTNAEEADFYGRQGFSGVVAANDLSLPQAVDLAEKALLPVGYSLGSVPLYRSKRKLITANGFEALAPWTTHLKEEKRAGRLFPIGENESGTMILRDRAISIPHEIRRENLPFAWLFVWRGAMDFSTFASFLRQEREGRR
jgi:collagenase-like PrtC family protease